MIIKTMIGSILLIILLALSFVPYVLVFCWAAIILASSFLLGHVVMLIIDDWKEKRRTGR
ncbi:MAG: hypothetical protein HWN81_11965 [Candidatus Lokiarchaeota archaeon]|nr:hypothetical protein [Candidatus Lokiarchaeota archaeon]